MKLQWIFLTALSFALSAQALTVQPGEVVDKTNLIKLKTVSFEGQQRQVLADGNGISVYTFDLDSENLSVCKGGCLRVWPPLEVPMGSQTNAPFGVIVGNNGKAQLTLKGLPLYYYIEDKNPSDTLGHYPDWQLVFAD